MTHPHVNLPLWSRKISFTHLFFEVAAVAEPYYNLANLEKAGTGVKQKEFIRRIGKSRAGARATHQRGGRSRGYFFVRAAGLGDTRTGHAAAHCQPLPYIYRRRRAIIAARGIFAAGGGGGAPRAPGRAEKPRG